MRSHTKAQQAPTVGCAGVSRQASRPSPVHTASTSRNFTSGGTIHTISRTEMMVRTTLNQLENRFCRIQAIGPEAGTGGGMGSTGARWTKARPASVMVAVSLMLALHQRDGAVVEVHQPWGDGADGQIDRHGDDHDLDRLSG